MKTYIHPDVAAVNTLYKELLTRPLARSVFELLNALADKLASEIRNGNPEATIELRNFHSAYIGQSPDEVIAQKPTLVDCQSVIANEFGFNSLSKIPSGLETNPAFEEALDLMVTGDLPSFKDVIEKQPMLAKQRSTFGHGGTLLHYASTNGIEIYRQMVPNNLPQMVNVLKDQGANLRATAQFYGQQLTPLELAITSDHPGQAGIRTELIDSLNYS